MPQTRDMSQGRLRSRRAARVLVLPSKKHLDDPWVKEAIEAGDLVVISKIPFWYRLWWWVKRKLGLANAKKDHQAQLRLEAMQKEATAKAEAGIEDQGTTDSDTTEDEE